MFFKSPFYLLIFCLVVLSIIESEDVKVLNSSIVFFEFCQFLLHVFGTLRFGIMCLYLLDFLDEFNFYHYKMSHFVSSNNFLS